MELKLIFNSVAILFAMIAIGYFVMTYLEDVASSIKAALSFLFALILFLVADYLRGGNK